MIVPETLIFVAEAWTLAGAVIACGFLLIGIDRIDPGARRAYAFRPLLIPGVILLWPLVLVIWFQRERRT